MYGLFSPENGVFVRLHDITRAGVDPSLQFAVLAFCEAEGAERAKPTVMELAGLKQLEVRALKDSP